MLKHVQTSLTKSYSAVKTSNKPCQKSHPQSLDRLQASSGHQQSPAVARFERATGLELNDFEKP
jgi:hypothetical protein